MDRLTFEKALDDISANESAGYGFSLTVLKEYFSKGVQLLADNELNPALPEQAFEITRGQLAQFVAGNLESPGYRTSRALSLALVPAGDPTLRETTPDTVSKLTLDEVKQYHAATVRPDLTTIVVIGDVTPEEARTAIEKWFGELEGIRPHAGHGSAADSREQAIGGQCARRPGRAGHGYAGRATEPESL